VAGSAPSAARSQPRDPSPSFRFQVTISGVTVARFAECAGLEFEQETFDYREGGLNSRVHRLPGRFKFGNLTLKKGIALDGKPLLDWIERVDKAANNGTLETQSVSVVLYDRAGQSVIRSWDFSGAYPVQWKATALSAEQSAVAIETLSLAHQGMQFAH
jgi:phage tail-like protein